ARRVRLRSFGCMLKIVSRSTEPEAICDTKRYGGNGHPRGRSGSRDWGRREALGSSTGQIAPGVLRVCVQSARRATFAAARQIEISLGRTVDEYLLQSSSAGRINGSGRAPATPGGNGLRLPGC